MATPKRSKSCRPPLKTKNPALRIRENDRGKTKLMASLHHNPAQLHAEGGGASISPVDNGRNKRGLGKADMGEELHHPVQ